MSGLIDTKRVRPIKGILVHWNVNSEQFLFMLAQQFDIDLDSLRSFILFLREEKFLDEP